MEKPMKDDLLEKLAALEHEQWVHWTSYMLQRLGNSKASMNPIVRKWFKQISTPYEKLSESEKESDRAWARKVLEVISEKSK